MSNPKKHLEYYSRIYPLAWKQVDHIRQGRGRDLPFWPEWCFLTLMITGKSFGWPWSLLESYAGHHQAGEIAGDIKKPPIRRLFTSQ